MRSPPSASPAREASSHRAWYWGIGVSVGLIVATTIVQLVLFRWRRWL